MTTKEKGRWPAVPPHVPSIPTDEDIDDREYISQAAEWLTACVRLADSYDGTVSSGERGRAPVEDHIFDFLLRLYNAVKKHAKN